MNKSNFGRVLLGSGLIALVLMACTLPSKFQDLFDFQSLSPFQPDTDTTLEGGEYRYSEINIPEGVIVSLEGDVAIQVDGPIQIDGTLTSSCNNLEIRGAENLTVTGSVSSTCPAEPSEQPVIRLIIAGNITLGDEVNGTPVLESDGMVFLSDPESETLDVEGLLDDISTHGAGSNPHRAAPIQGGGKECQINRPVRGKAGVEIRITGQVDLKQTVYGQDGSTLEKMTSDQGKCDASNTIGGDGGSVKIIARNDVLTLGSGVWIIAGNGGSGQECEARNGCPAEAHGGQGGNGGSILLVADEIIFNENVALNPGNGGLGGNAWAYGRGADDECADGCGAIAMGGKGGEGGRLDVVSALNIIRGNPLVGSGNGEQGGVAVAVGSHGRDCATCPAGKGGDGGEATALGGQGGDAFVGEIPNGWLSGDSLKSGNGGQAMVRSGNGGAGATCCDPVQQGGDGGKGGNAAAAGGQPGDKGTGGKGQRGESYIVGDMEFIAEENKGGTGSGGNGGAGDPFGKGGAGGTGAGDPNPIPDGLKGLDGDVCFFKKYDVFFGEILPGWVHGPNKSFVQWVLKVLGNDPIPMPDALITIQMTGSGYSELMTANTDQGGIARGEFTIYSYGMYEISLLDIQGENMVYEPSLNAVQSVRVQVGAGDNPAPETIGETVPEFIGLLSGALRTGDTDFLQARLNPAVLERYGRDACLAHFDTLINETFEIEIEEISGPGSWVFERDGLSVAVGDVYSVKAYQIINDISNNVEMHFARGQGGSLTWFTDCGEPIQE